MRCKFLPPYSPNFNPIELAFLAMKYHLRRNGNYTRMAMTEMSDEEILVTLLRALYIITPADAYGWYAHCGYVWLSCFFIISTTCTVVLVHFHKSTEYVSSNAWPIRLIVNQRSVLNDYYQHMFTVHLAFTYSSQGLPPSTNEHNAIHFISIENLHLIVITRKFCSHYTISFDMRHSL